MKCNETLQESAILDCYCMTYNESTGVVAGPCFYNCENIPKGQVGILYHPLPHHVEEVNSAMCGQFHRGGQLCGSCEEGYSPLVYSYDLLCSNCTDIHYNWIKYVTVAFIPLTVFFIILWCRVSAISPQLYAFVNFSQNIAFPTNMRLVLSATVNYPKIGTLVRTIAALYGIWNLDFFHALIPHICLEVNTLQALALDYAIACYPLLLLVAFYMLIELHAHNFRLIVYHWRPFRRVFINFRKQWDIKNSQIVQVFATFLLLSNVKLLSVSFDLLTPTEVCNINGSLLGLFLWYDGSVVYFGKEHLPYAVLALLLLLIFVIFPIVLLLLYPLRCFQRVFMDAFQGCYKDGTNGTRDCQYFGALYLIMCIISFFVIALTLDVLGYAVIQFMLIVFAMLIAIIQPYKAQFAIYNIVDTVFILILALWYCTSLCLELAALKDHRYATTSKVAMGVVGVLPLFYITAITLHWLCSQTKIGRNMIRKIQGCVQHQHFLQLQGVNDEEAFQP